MFTLKVETTNNRGEANFRNYYGQVRVLLDFYFGDEEDRKAAQQKLRNESPAAVSLKKFYEEDHIQTREALLAQKPVNGGSDSQGSEKRGERKSRRRLTVDQPAPGAPRALVMTNGTLTGGHRHVYRPDRRARCQAAKANRRGRGYEKPQVIGKHIDAIPEAGIDTPVSGICDF